MGEAFLFFGGFWNFLGRGGGWSALLNGRGGSGIRGGGMDFEVGLAHIMANADEFRIRGHPLLCSARLGPE